MAAKSRMPIVLARHVASMTNPPVMVAAALVASLVTACGSRPEAIDAAKSPEQIVFARSEDGVVSGGVLFSPPPESAKPLAVIWVHDGA